MMQHVPACKIAISSQLIGSISPSSAGGYATTAGTSCFHYARAKCHLHSRTQPTGKDGPARKRRAASTCGIDLAIGSIDIGSLRPFRRTGWQKHRRPMSMDDANVLTWHEQVQRKTSLPRADSAQDEQRPRGKSAPGVPPTGDTPPRRRGFSLARHQSVPVMSVGKSRRRRKVTFKNMYAPDVVPPPKVESYDELVFNVAGLFHTMSFLHDPEDWGDDPTGSMSSEDEYYDPEPLERSVPLMIAEFLYRSAMFLGYPQGDTPWLPGFREDKKFSGNDVKRWRRLAHFDWEAEEREFQLNHRKPPSLTAFQPGLERKESVESNGHKSVMSTIGASFHMRRQDSAVSVDSMSSSSSMDNPVSSHSGKTKFRSAVSGWIRKHRRQHGTESLPVAEQVSEDESGEKSEEKKKRKHKPVSWLNPPPISSSRDLALLVDIINSCVYCGQFQFRKRDIVRLCNIRI